MDTINFLPDPSFFIRLPLYCGRATTRDLAAFSNTSARWKPYKDQSDDRTLMCGELAGQFFLIMDLSTEGGGSFFQIRGPFHPLAFRAAEIIGKPEYSMSPACISAYRAYMKGDFKSMFWNLGMGMDKWCETDESRELNNIIFQYGGGKQNGKLA